jgi:hypothetical protein
VTSGGGDLGGELVVVPAVPGPVIAVDPHGAGRSRDDLDDLIDDLLPDTDERPGWFDAGLLVVGITLLAVGLVAGVPAFFVVVGVAALTLGCVLPLRTAWRRVDGGRRTRRRSGLLAAGVPFDISSPTTNRLVSAYETLLALDGARADGGPAVAAAHGALLEAATLLGGRTPESARERDYVESRAAAVEALVEALTPSVAEDATAVDAATLVEARAEVEGIAGLNSVTRLEELAEEARSRRHGPA